jgi:hypothetical protein
MKVYIIEQFMGPDLSDIEVTDEEGKILEQLEKTENIFMDNGKMMVGIFSDQYVDYIVSLFRKYNVLYQVTNITNHYIDNILDKISQSGINSLTNNEKQTLKLI